jgi:hypothetical protein
MFVMTLESLVLRGVSVLGGGESVNLRLGSEYAGLQAPTIGHPMPHSMPIPSPSADRPDWQSFCQPVDADRFADRLREVKDGMGEQRGGNPSSSPGAGRSPRHAGGAFVRKTRSTSTWSRTPGIRTSLTASPTRCLATGNSSKATSRTLGLAEAAGNA